jgi:CNP1-like family
MRFKSLLTEARGIPGLVLCALLLVESGVVAAQPQSFMENPDWKESEVPAPPAFDFGKLQTFEVASNPNMVYGVDPASISISKSDSVVRYVMVATSPSGVRNVMYEALHCSTGEVKTYARYVPEGRWQPVTNPQWRSVFDKTPSMHALAFARQGACDARAPAGSVGEIVSKLKNTGRYLDQ